MTTAVRSAPLGSNFVRIGIAQAIAAATGESPANVAERRWGGVPALVLRSTVPGLGHGDVFGHERAVAAEFFDAVAQLSVVGRLAGIRRVPLRTRLISVATGSVGYWVAEGRGKPASRQVFSADTLSALKVVSLVIATRELIESTDPSAELTLRRDMMQAVAEAIDESFLDPANSGVADESPPSVTFGAPASVAGSDPTGDIKALVESFGGNLETSYFIMRPEIGVALAGSDRPNVGARGGELYGIPVICSRSSAADTIALVDAGGIALGEGPAELRVSRQTNIEMLDEALIQDGTTGTGTSVVSMFQCNGIAVLVEREMNWRTVREGSVALLTDIAYSPIVT